MTKVKLEHGLFVPPYHDIDESPTIGLRRDLELVEWVEKLGFAEVWFGEHHSTGWETIASPELMIAAAAERTSRIRLGTGVISLPYHHPLTVANRIIQLDHMSMGRLMFGIGPGILTTDARMMGVDLKETRNMMVESIECILPLLRGEEVTHRASWFTLDRAKVHLMPYSQPYPEIVVASAITPSGGMLAGKHGFGMLCVAATETSGFEVLGSNWNVAKKIAEEHGHAMNPQQLRLVAPMHLAETREAARAQVRDGLRAWANYMDRIAPKGMRGWMGDGDPVDSLVAAGRAVIGTPADAITLIERLQAKQGEFGTMLFQANNWANWTNTKNSYDLYARFVMPHFSRVNRNRRSSFDQLIEDFDALDKEREAGVQKAFEKWKAHEEKRK